MKNQNAIKHGESRPGAWTPEYRAWASMIRRCTNSKQQNYPRYGGAGITVCQRWLESYEAFLEDMGRKPTPQHTLDRKKSTGNYEPDNCQWATNQEQDRNRSTARMPTYKGESLNLSIWAERFGLKPLQVSKRLGRGWSIEDALTKPIGNNGYGN